MKSMTGFAKRQCVAGGMTVTVEIKTLNSKQLDLGVKIPQRYRSHDLEVRSMLSRLNRGKIDFVLSEILTSAGDAQLNRELLKARFSELSAATKDMGVAVSDGELVTSLVRQSDLWFSGSFDDISDDDWAVVSSCISDAIDDVEQFRSHEGSVLEKDFVKHVDAIEQRLNLIPQYESGRIDAARDRIKRYFSDFAVKEVDPVRFEQELIYYLEKLDITEEKVRLAKHIAFFRDTMRDEEICGKKLAFVAQEMGREINTTGSKANHVEIQRLVVEMKDELEKIKEQLGNIL
ncbi:MAG: YicC family protein [Bacteroidales bacterium]|nr:YicC family protein [Bacteroidales bacterium]